MSGGSAAGYGNGVGDPGNRVPIPITAITFSCAITCNFIKKPVPLTPYITSR